MIKQLLQNRVSKTLLTIAAFIMVAISASAQEPTWTAEAYDCLNEGWSGSVFSGGYNFDNITVEYYEETNTLVAKNFMGGEGTNLTIVLDADGKIKTINGEERDSYGSVGVYTGYSDYYFAYIYPDYDTYVAADKDNGYIILSGYFYKNYNDAGSWLYYMISWPKPAPAEKFIELSSYNINTTGGTFSFDKNIEFAGGATTITAKSTKSGNSYPATLSLDPDNYKVVNLSFEKSLKVGNTYTIEIPDNCIKSIEDEALKDTVLTFTVTETGTTVVEEPTWTTHATVWAGDGYFYNPDNNDVIVSYYEKSHTLKIENYLGDYSDELSVVVNTEGGTDDYGDYSVTSINGSGEYGGGYAGWSYSAGAYIDDPYYVNLYAPYCYALPEYESGEFGGEGFGYNSSSYWGYYYISWYNDDTNKNALKDAIAAANSTIDYANANGLKVPSELTSAVEAGQEALDTENEDAYVEKAADINKAMSTDYLTILEDVAEAYDVFKSTPVGVNVFEYTPGTASKLSEAFNKMNTTLSGTSSSTDLYYAMKDLKAALNRYNVTLPKTNETFTIQNKADGLYLNIADGEAYVAETPTYFQFHKVVDETTGAISWYLYNTEERSYMGYEDNVNVIEEWSRKSQFYVGSVSKNIWYIAPISNPKTFVMAGRLNNVIFGNKECAHSEWYIAYSDVPTYDITEAEQETSQAEATAITAAQAANIDGTFYTMNGAKLAVAQKGINIVKYNNGTVKKVLVK